MRQSVCKYCEQTWHQSYQCFYKPNKLAKPCKFCQSNEHLSWQCFNNPKRKEQMRSKIKKGKVTKKWLSVRRKWYKDNPAEFYICYICKKQMKPEESTLDHIKNRSGHPELRFDVSNLAPCCWPCNQRKGSQSLENIMKPVDKL